MAIVGVKHGIQGRGSYNVELKLEGDIYKFNLLTRNADTLLATAAISAQKTFAEAYRDKVIQNIKEGGRRFHYAPHSLKYAAYKARYGGGSRLLVWSGTMADSVIIKDAAGGTRQSVGISKGAKRPNQTKWDLNRLSVSEYANVLEHGRPPYMPARPVFGDTFREHMGGMAGLKAALEIGIVKTMGKRGIRVNKI